MFPHSYSQFHSGSLRVILQLGFVQSDPLCGKLPESKTMPAPAAAAQLTPCSLKDQDTSKEDKLERAPDSDLPWGERGGMAMGNIHPSCSEPWCRHSCSHSWSWLGFPAECGERLSSSFSQWSDHMKSTCLSEHGLPDCRVRQVPVPQSFPFSRESPNPPG